MMSLQVCAGSLALNDPSDAPMTSSLTSRVRVRVRARARVRADTPTLF